ncbi:MAG: helix-turn-helix transcriptional regulator [Nitrospiraceae bacterium]|nr:helix-turn-helix transcriptional regulator [Nitrospiraceae bacterium]
MPESSPITADQCRAARALLEWTRSELSTRSLVANSTLADFEAGKREPHRRTLVDVRRTLEDAGVIFQGADTLGGPGVRLTKKG